MPISKSHANYFDWERNATLQKEEFNIPKNYEPQNVAEISETVNTHCY